eukprot:489702_1
MMSTFHFLVSFVSLNSVSAQSNDYFVDARTNCNAVALQESNGNVQFLGKFNKTKECITACINYKTNHSKCLTYTYFYPTSINYTSECWAYIDNPLWLPYPINGSDCGRIIYPCQSDSDCSYNGICNITTGNCACDAAWNGYKCDNLNGLPVTTNTGYNLSDISSWGGSVIYDKYRNIYTMFAAEMSYNCGLNTWQTNSQIVYAETKTDNWNVNYTRISMILPPFAHEPNIIYAPNTDEYVLMYIHNKTSNDMPPCTTCTDGSSGQCGHTSQNVTASTAIRYIKNLSNAYDIKYWSDPILLYGIGDGDTNFAAQINNNGSLIGMIRDTGRNAQLVYASNWKDNTTYERFNQMLFPTLPFGGTEDFYLYKDCKGRWHALFHNKAPQTHNDPNQHFNSQYLCGAHAFSENGIDNWIYGGYAFNNTVIYVDGEIVTYGRRERPHLIFDKDGCTPIGLSTGVQHHPDHTYTLVQPLNQRI